MRLEIMDTTLRDGEQTSGVSFAAVEKLSIAKLLLEEVKVDRIEIASARVSQGEFESVKRIALWARQAGLIDRIEILGFIDGTVSVDWIADAGCKVLNLLAKGSYKHVSEQLRKTPEQHIDDIKKVIAYAQTRDVAVNLYLEDWSNGMLNSPEYVFTLVDGLLDQPIKRLLLPDTLGILNPLQTYNFCKQMVDRYPKLHMDFHAHNDYDLAVADAFEAIRAGVHGIHTTVNGLGERAGNAPLSSVMGIINDHLKIKTGVDETKLTRVSKIVESYSGIRIPTNKPLIGEFVFTQTAGIHADGDSKNNLYFNALLPERFGRKREYALGKNSGKASIKKNLEEMGIDLDDESMKLITKRIIELGDKKERVSKEDLPYIISDVLDAEAIEQKIKVLNYSLSLAYGLKPVAQVRIMIDDKPYQETAIGDGQYDAFMKALWKIYDRLGKKHPTLVDYMVTIPPGGRTDAFVEAMIRWDFKGRVFKTRGFDADQTEAAIQATVKMLNLIEHWQ